MLQHDHRQSAGAASDPELSGGDRRAGISVTAQELCVRQRQGVDRMELGAGRHVLRDRLGERERRYERNSQHTNQAQAAHHFLPLSIV